MEESDKKGSPSKRSFLETPVGPDFSKKVQDCVSIDGEKKRTLCNTRKQAERVLHLVYDAQTFNEIALATHVLKKVNVHAFRRLLQVSKDLQDEVRIETTFSRHVSKTLELLQDSQSPEQQQLELEQLLLMLAKTYERFPDLQLKEPVLKKLRSKSVREGISNSLRTSKKDFSIAISIFRSVAKTRSPRVIAANTSLDLQSKQSLKPPSKKQTHKSPPQDQLAQERDKRSLSRIESADEDLATDAKREKDDKRKSSPSLEKGDESFPREKNESKAEPEGIEDMNVGGDDDEENPFVIPLHPPSNASLSSSSPGPSKEPEPSSTELTSSISTPAVPESEAIPKTQNTVQNKSRRVTFVSTKEGMPSKTAVMDFTPQPGQEVIEYTRLSFDKKTGQYVKETCKIPKQAKGRRAKYSGWGPEQIASGLHRFPGELESGKDDEEEIYHHVAQFEFKPSQPWKAPRMVSAPFWNQGCPWASPSFSTPEAVSLNTRLKYSGSLASVQREQFRNEQPRVLDTMVGSIEPLTPMFELGEYWLSQGPDVLRTLFEVWWMKWRTFKDKESRLLEFYASLHAWLSNDTLSNEMYQEIVLGTARDERAVIEVMTSCSDEGLLSFLLEVEGAVKRNILSVESWVEHLTTPTRIGDEQKSPILFASSYRHGECFLRIVDMLCRVAELETFRPAVLASDIFEDGSMKTYLHQLATLDYQNASETLKFLFPFFKYAAGGPNGVYHSYLLRTNADGKTAFDLGTPGFREAIEPELQLCVQEAKKGLHMARYANFILLPETLVADDVTPFSDYIDEMFARLANMLENGSMSQMELSYFLINFPLHDPIGSTLDQLLLFISKRRQVLPNVAKMVDSYGAGLNLLTEKGHLHPHVGAALFTFFPKPFDSPQFSISKARSISPLRRAIRTGVADAVVAFIKLMRRFAGDKEFQKQVQEENRGNIPAPFFLSPEKKRALVGGNLIHEAIQVIGAAGLGRFLELLEESVDDPVLLNRILSQKNSDGQLPTPSHPKVLSVWNSFLNTLQKKMSSHSTTTKKRSRSTSPVPQKKAKKKASSKRAESPLPSVADDGPKIPDTTTNKSKEEKSESLLPPGSSDANPDMTAPSHTHQGKEEATNKKRSRSDTASTSFQAQNESTTAKRSKSSASLNDMEPDDKDGDNNCNNVIEKEEGSKKMSKAERKKEARKLRREKAHLLKSEEKKDTASKPETSPLLTHLTSESEPASAPLSIPDSDLEQNVTAPTLTNNNHNEKETQKVEGGTSPFCNVQEKQPTDESVASTEERLADLKASKVDSVLEKQVKVKAMHEDERVAYKLARFIDEKHGGKIDMEDLMPFYTAYPESMMPIGLVGVESFAKTHHKYLSADDVFLYSKLRDATSSTILQVTREKSESAPDQPALLLEISEANDADMEHHMKREGQPPTLASIDSHMSNDALSVEDFGADSQQNVEGISKEPVASHANIAAQESAGTVMSLQSNSEPTSTYVSTRAFPNSKIDTQPVPLERTISSTSLESNIAMPSEEFSEMQTSPPASIANPLPPSKDSSFDTTLEGGSSSSSKRYSKLPSSDTTTELKPRSLDVSKTDDSKPPSSAASKTEDPNLSSSKTTKDSKHSFSNATDAQPSSSKTTDEKPSSSIAIDAQPSSSDATTDSKPPSSAASKTEDPKLSSSKTTKDPKPSTSNATDAQPSSCKTTDEKPSSSNAIDPKPSSSDATTELKPRSLAVSKTDDSKPPSSAASKTEDPKLSSSKTTKDSKLSTSNATDAQPSSSKTTDEKPSSSNAIDAKPSSSDATTDSKPSSSETTDSKSPSSAASKTEDPKLSTSNATDAQPSSSKTTDEKPSSSNAIDPKPSSSDATTELKPRSLAVSKTDDSKPPSSAASKTEDPKLSSSKTTKDSKPSSSNATDAQPSSSKTTDEKPSSSNAIDAKPSSSDATTDSKPSSSDATTDSKSPSSAASKTEDPKLSSFKTTESMSRSSSSSKSKETTKPSSSASRRTEPKPSSKVASQTEDSKSLSKIKPELERSSDASPSSTSPSRRSRSSRSSSSSKGESRPISLERTNSRDLGRSGSSSIPPMLSSSRYPRSLQRTTSRDSFRRSPSSSSSSLFPPPLRRSPSNASSSSTTSRDSRRGGSSSTTFRDSRRGGDSHSPDIDREEELDLVADITRFIASRVPPRVTERLIADNFSRSSHLIRRMLRKEGSLQSFFRHHRYRFVVQDGLISLLPRGSDPSYNPVRQNRFPQGRPYTKALPISERLGPRPERADSNRDSSSSDARRPIQERLGPRPQR